MFNTNEKWRERLQARLLVWGLRRGEVQLVGTTWFCGAPPSSTKCIWPSVLATSGGLFPSSIWSHKGSPICQHTQCMENKWRWGKTAAPIRKGNSVFRDLVWDWEGVKRCVYASVNNRAKEKVIKGERQCVNECAYLWCLWGGTQNQQTWCNLSVRAATGTSA